MPDGPMLWTGRPLPCSIRGRTSLGGVQVGPVAALLATPLTAALGACRRTRWLDGLSSLSRCSWNA